MLEVYPWQETQWRRMNETISQKRISHALLLTGPEGIGLGHYANCLAAKLLCSQSNEEGFACGECRFCTLFNAGNHPDFVSIAPEEKGKQIKVELIRQLNEKIFLSSQYGQYKVVIIDPAETMNKSAANSLLKTLEEPPAGSLLVLISHQPSLLPVTIRSRCQRVNFPSADFTIALNWLKQQPDLEQTGLEQLLLSSQGAPLKVMELQEADSLSQQKSVIQDLVELRARRVDPIRVAEKWLAFGAVEVMQWFLKLLYSMVRIKLGVATEKQFDAKENSHLQELADRLDLAQLIQCYDHVLASYRAITGRISLNKQGLLEDVIISWQSLESH